MKAGTTWLQHQLQDHPEILFTPEKEIHYFTAPDGTSPPMRLEDRIARFKRVVGNVTAERFNPRVKFNLHWYTSRYLKLSVDDTWYESLFQHAKPGQWCADFSNLYCLMDEDGWSHVRSIAKDLRVIYTLRHPLKRLWSQVVFYHEYSGTDVDLSSWSKGAFHDFFRSGQEGAHFDYAGNLTRLRQVLYEDEFKLLFFEQQRNAPSMVLNEIEAFLGITERHLDAARLDRKVNASASTLMPPSFVDYAAPIHDEQVSGLRDLGLDLPDSWSRAF